MAKADENYVERLCNSVAKKMVEVIENITIEDVNAYQIGYNKAIDEFAELIIEAYSYIPKSFVRDLAEQMKDSTY